MVGEAGCGLVGAGGMIGLRPHSSGYAFMLKRICPIQNGKRAFHSSYVDVCNFHMHLLYSYGFAILLSLFHHLLEWLCMVSMSQ